MTKKKDFKDDFSDEDVVGDLNFWSYDNKGDSVIGLFKRMQEDKYGEHAVIIDENEKELHLPNLTVINRKLQQANADEGDKIKVEFLGKEKAEDSGREYNNFKVQVKKQ